MGLQPEVADGAGAGFMLPGDQSSQPNFDRALPPDAGNLATDLTAGAGPAADAGPDGAGKVFVPPVIQPLWPDSATGFPPDPGFTSAPAFGGDASGDTTVLQNPEPASLLLFGMGGGILALASYRRWTSSVQAHAD
jgi:hypothetical protein